MKRILKKCMFPIMGLLSLVWFLVRVIPKPSRAAYPCMKAAWPIASSFVIYIVGLFSSIVLFKKAKKFMVESRYVLFTVFFIAALIIGSTAFLHTDKKVYADYQTSLEAPNEPMGTGVGIYPGRVVWIHEPDVTNENCTNWNNDYWWDDNNTNQELVKKMVSDALQMLSGKATDAEAWDAIFRNHNQNHGKGDVGYSTGEKIVIKINLNSGVSGARYERSRWGFGNIDTSPQIVYAVLDQLINVAGVAQSDISIGDPGKTVDNLYWDRCHPDFPDVNYWGEGNGRTLIERSQNFEIFTSDGSLEDWLPTCYLDAAYMINIPVLKKHHRAGISLTSKNHFGSFVPFRGAATHWHFSLPASEGNADVNNGEYGLYRCFVDFMGHEHIGAKTILYIVDGIWSSTNWGHPPIKWRMEPFNNDWPSSIFVSQDPVAIQSVGFDFLFEEFDENHPTEGSYDPSDNRGPFPHYAGSDDFLHQAADSQNWPEGIIYDPEGDGTPLPQSMGTHEHWNNAIEKKYSRNLGMNEGIELITNVISSSVAQENKDLFNAIKDFALYQNYPNPFNATTTIGYSLLAPAQINLAVYNSTGQKIRTLMNAHQVIGSHVLKWDGLMDNGLPVSTGIYYYKLIAQSKDQSFEQMRKMLLVK